MIDSLKDLINHKYTIAVDSTNPKNSSIIITETHPDAKLKTVEITGFSDLSTYAFKLDLDNERVFNC